MTCYSCRYIGQRPLGDRYLYRAEEREFRLWHLARRGYKHRFGLAVRRRPRRIPSDWDTRARIWDFRHARRRNYSPLFYLPRRYSDRRGIERSWDDHIPF